MIMMNGDKLPTNQLHDINWGAVDHASRAPQLTSCNYYCIRSIRRHGYYLFHPPSLYGVYSRAATIRERRLLIPLAAIFRKMVD